MGIPGDGVCNQQSRQNCGKRQHFGDIDGLDRQYVDNNNYEIDISSVVVQGALAVCRFRTNRTL
jgi:hypothetical protein